MNVNDLADRLEEFYKGTHITKAAEVLRQQQAEIEVLKKLLDDFGITVNKKPAKYSDAWWKEVEEFNKQLKVQEK